MIRTETPLTDLGAALLRAALGFAERRLRQVEADALATADALAGALGVASPPDPAAVEIELAAARASLRAFRADLAESTALPTARLAATDLADALRHLDNAVDLVEPGTNLLALITGAFTASVAPTGLAAQLGLQNPTAPTYAGSVLTYMIGSAGAGTMSGAIPLRFASVSLIAELRLAPDPSLALSIAIDQASFSLGAGFDAFVFLRDETANLAWAVERRVQAPSGDDRARADEGTRPPPPAPGDTNAELDCRLQLGVPEQWIPQLPRTTGYRAIELVQGRMRRADGSLVPPLGVLLNQADASPIATRRSPGRAYGCGGCRCWPVVRRHVSALGGASGRRGSR